MTDDNRDLDSLAEDAALPPEAEPMEEDMATEQPPASRPAAARPAKPDPARKAPPAPAGAGRLQPGFVLSASGEQLTREELLARYRRQRGLPEDPFENGARPVPSREYRERMRSEPRPVQFVRSQPQAEAEEPVRPRRSFTLGQTIAIATAMSLVSGGVAGVVGARLWPTIEQHAAALANPAEAAAVAPAPRLQVSDAAAVNDTVVDKKPIATATLQVADVTGETNSFIPLALHAEPGGLDKDILLKISGVPEGAYLTSGHRQDDEVWALSLSDSRDVKLVVPKATEPQIDLAVAAFEPKTGELAAPVKTMTVALKDVVVEPTSAPPPGQQAVSPKSTLPGATAAAPVAIPPPQSVTLALAMPESAETQQLLGKAGQLFASGDVSGARRAYERAWGNDGSAAAAYGLARSYDPIVLAGLAAGNAVPDKAQAIQWYQRAASGGNPDAAAAIIRLQMKP